MSNRKQMMLYAAGMTIATSGAWAQNQSYQAYTARSQAIQNNADASTNQALRTIQRAINKDKAQENAITNTYVRQNYPRLRQQYITSGASRTMTFNQFASQELRSHATAPPSTGAFTAGQAAHRAQEQRFQGMQDAARTRREAGDTLIQSGQRASDARINTVDRATKGSIQGQSEYRDPSTGGTQWMSTNAPGYHQGADGTRYYQDQNGRAYQQQGSSWVDMGKPR